MPKQILSVGYDFPGGVVEHVPLASTQSLLDADIIVFEPGLGPYSAESTYQGKDSLWETDSFEVKERLQHWRRELQAALNVGKVLVVFMVKPEEVFVKTGRTDVSGTGRNARVTHYVEPLSSYAALPFGLKGAVAATGAGIVPTGDLKYLATLWQEFGSRFRYETYFDGTFTDVLLRTRSGDRLIGAALRKGRGAALLLPPLHFDPDELVRTDEKGSNPRWTKAASKIGERLLQCLVEVWKAIASEAQITPAPAWVNDRQYRLPVESSLESAIALTSAEIERLHAEREALKSKLREAGSLRRLLFEKGPQLEQAIIEALRLLGFLAEPFHDADSEFDAVFTSEEGRFLGEAEGRDNHAVNIDKLSQLERNIQEEFAREEVEVPAKGVLFGNAYRLQPLADRGDFFTLKCRTGATRSRVALVRTPDLFVAAHYLKGNDDAGYAKACRVALLQTEGVEVTFPAPPRPEGAADDTPSIEVRKNAG